MSDPILKALELIALAMRAMVAEQRETNRLLGEMQGEPDPEQDEPEHQEGSLSGARGRVVPRGN